MSIEVAFQIHANCNTWSSHYKKSWQILCEDLISFWQLHNSYHFQIDFRLFIKSSSNWRQLIKLDRIVVCPILEGVNALPVLATFRDIIYSIVPTLPRKCPFTPMRLTLQNATIMSPEFVEHIKKLMNDITATLLPNGVYRGVVKFYNDKDLQGFIIYYHIEVYFRLNDEVF